ncbi:hypothetical protein GGR50DRAFT_686711 [Xylaria sp. CBS 124048]|nr:hypothetical protein GGR50DRAFT_686711 [Xylaria sp. CBS 124048]
MARNRHATHPTIPLITPADPTFETLRACFVKRDSEIPAAIARPQTATDVQVLIKYCTKHHVDFIVRCGGHDCTGRSQKNGSLSIDLRDIRHVTLSEDEKAAVIGGGILLRDLAEALDERGLITPVGSVASVGYVGWATLGGYGPFSLKYGLGVDQITGAKLVNAKGELIEAGADLLQGIRGGGGNFGVIVELTIKVYPLKELLTSLIIYESSNPYTAWTNYAMGYERLKASQPLPPALQLQPFAIELPGRGKVLAVSATWASPNQEEGKAWFDRIAGLGTCVVNRPEAKSVRAYASFNEALVVYGSYGRSFTLSVKRYTPKTVALLAKYTDLLPGGSIAISAHTYWPGVPGTGTTPVTAPATASVFRNREPHLMLEFVAVTPAPELGEKGAEWASDLMRELREQDPENVLEGGYISLMADGETDIRSVYGVHYDTLMALKRKYDPDNVFRNAVPRLEI